MAVLVGHDDVALLQVTQLAVGRVALPARHPRWAGEGQRRLPVEGAQRSPKRYGTLLPSFQQLNETRKSRVAQSHVPDLWGGPEIEMVGQMKLKWRSLNGRASGLFLHGVQYLQRGGVMGNSAVLAVARLGAKKMKRTR